MSKLTDYIYDRWLSNNMDFPVGAIDFHHPFGKPVDIVCHIGAIGVFSLLTGISCHELKVLGYGDHYHLFDRGDKKKLVHYFDLTWKESNRNPYHAFVYYDGYLYKSYLTYRNWWSWFIDAYPLIRMKLEKADRDFFEREEISFRPDLFNRLCAPSSHPIPLDAVIRCSRLYMARVNPTRSTITLIHRD